MTLRTILTAAFMTLASAGAMAQSVKIAGTLRGSVPADLKLYVMPVGVSSLQPDSVSVNGQKILANTPVSPYNIYKVVAVANRRQNIVPVHLTVKKDAANLSMTIDAEGNIDFNKADADTKALVAFNDISVVRSKQLWMDGKTMQAEALKSLVLGYPAIADSLIRAYRPSTVTTQYLRLWASTFSFENMENLRFATGRMPQDVGVDIAAEAKRIAPAVDCPMSSAFDSSPRVVLASLPQGSLDERISAVENSVKDALLKLRIEDVLLNKYITTFRYAVNYDEGLSELTLLTERYGLDKKYLSEFKKRKATVSGNMFPADVVLNDLNGNKVDFAKFRGKYVYIDMWASWCVPCIKEIPHLKAIEKDLQNEDVVFLSISIDSNVEAWKKKVAQLGLEGNLLIDAKGTLAQSLNVNGIPFFLIYDREGRMYKYNAPRPSDARLKPLLEGLK